MTDTRKVVRSLDIPLTKDETVSCLTGLLRDERAFVRYITNVLQEERTRRRNAERMLQEERVRRDNTVRKYQELSREQSSLPVNTNDIDDNDNHYTCNFCAGYNSLPDIVHKIRQKKRKHYTRTVSL